MSKLGVIARCDGGGLAALLTEMVRHVRPDYVLHVDLGPQSRGRASDPSLLEPHCERMWTGYHGAWTSDGLPEEFFAACAGGVVYTAETLYDKRAYGWCREYDIRLVVHAMPELLDLNEIHGADLLWLPTGWLEGDITWRCSAAGKLAPTVMPVPIATDHFAGRARKRTKAEVFYCDGGEAFHDRDGQRIVYEAAWSVGRPCKVYVRGGPHPPERTWEIGKVTFEWLDPVEHYWDAVPDDVDVRLQPRRYGGLCLGVQETAALGIPTVMTDLPPNDWYAPLGAMRVPVIDGPGGYLDVRMKGGTFPVYQVAPAALAGVWNDLLDRPTLTADASDMALDFADGLAWDRWTDRYRDALRRSA